jgi:hypothetical protein
MSFSVQVLFLGGVVEGRAVVSDVKAKRAAGRERKSIMGCVGSAKPSSFL